MPIYNAPVKEMLFVLNEMLNLNKYSNLPGYADATPDMVEAILEEGAKICENELAPLNLSGDIEGCVRHDDGSVTTPKGFKEAYNKYKEGGWTGLSHNPKYGGQGLPHVIGFCMQEMMSSANMAFTMYPGLSAGAMASIDLDASDELKQKFLPKMVAGDWTGTMNLTEPHCGTDLGLMRTKAEPNDDGSHAITGTKIFISAGEHDLADNIIHLVLARITGAPEGVKGISLFIVPKYLVNEDGSLGEHNKLICGSIEEKMGIHANSTCTMNFDGATGYLVGTEHKGLRAMFTMMNHARTGVAVQGYAQSEVSYQNAVAYANDRIQGRSLTGAKNPDKAADTLMVHPDVRRMLMNAKSFNEAARAASLWCALLIDLSSKAETEEERQWADDIVGLLTPVMKGVFTDRGYEFATTNQQVFGGHGYISEHGMGQFVRDARIAQIYEGANGIQALDLVGRKLPANGGRAIQALFKHIGSFISDNKDNEKMTPFTGPLSAALTDLQGGTMWLMQNAMQNPDHAGAASTPYMHLMGHVLLAFQWAQMAKISLEQLDAGTTDPTFYENKIITGRFYMRHRLPETKALLAELQAGADDMMALDAANF
ncbi:MAG: acyl-CoA dehydrogenase [Kordiimonadales bacterium]|nr:MAG: acyl-CoA dehydrogenase [Kordiimonadales bacterium]